MPFRDRAPASLRNPSNPGHLATLSRFPRTNPRPLSRANLSGPTASRTGPFPHDTLARQCRAYAPWPGLYTHWQGKTLKVLQANSSSASHVVALTPGQVTGGATGNDILVSTGEGSLALKRVQLEGRRPVAAEEFLRGYPDFIGSVLGDR